MDRKKTCCKCREEKDLTGFYKDPTKNLGVKSYCKTCYNEHQKEKRRTPLGKLKQCYHAMVHRTSTRKTYCNINILFSKQEFLDKYLNNKTYEKLYSSWKDSGYNTALSPSFDRINNKKDYNFDNLQIIIHSENAAKGKGRKIGGKVSKYIGVTLDTTCQNRNKKFKASLKISNKTTTLGYFYTEKEAAISVNNKCKELGIPIKNILL